MLQFQCGYVLEKVVYKMSKKGEKCDLLGCEETENLNPFTKYLELCESHWFYIMNGVRKISSEEGEHFTKLEEERGQ